MADNSSNLVRYINLQIQEVEQTSNKINLKPKHIKIKLFKTKDKDKNLESSQEKPNTLTARVKTIWLTVDFSSEIFWRPEESSTKFIKSWKKKNCKPRFLYSMYTNSYTQYPSGNEGEIKTFSHKWKLTEYISRSTLKELLNSLKRKKIIKEGTLELQEGRKNQVSKNMGKYDRLYFSSWVFQSMLDSWSKNYNTVWYGAKCMEEIFKTITL